MTQNSCERCTRPLTDTAYVCSGCTRPVVEDLTSVPSLAEELPAARYRQTRYGSGGLGGWQEPWDDRAREVEQAVTNTLTTVARDVAETRGIEVIVHVPPAVHGPPCVRWCAHGSCHDIRRTRREPCTWVADGCRHGVCNNSRVRAPLHLAGLVATWLVGQLDWVRHQQGAVETPRRAAHGGTGAAAGGGPTGGVPEDRAESAGPPRVGVESDEYRAVCVYSADPGSPQCGEPATVHVLANTAAYGLVALASCEAHASIARAAGDWQAEHPFKGFCGLPSTIWHLRRNECVIDDSGVEPALVAAAEAR